MSIRNRLSFSILAVLALIALILAVSTWNGEKYSHSVLELQRVVDKHLRLIAIARQLDQHYKKIQILSNFVDSAENTGSSSIDLATETRHLTELVNEIADIYRHSNLTDRPQMDAFRTVLGVYIAQWTAFEGTRFNSAGSRELDALMSNVNLYFGKVMLNLNSLQNAEKKAVASASENILGVKRRTDQITYTIFGSSLLIAGLIAYTFVSSVVVRLKTLEQGAIRLGEDDSTQRIELNSKDEFGNLAQILNDLNEKLTKAKHEAQTAKEKANDANEARSSFLASMSHELRTPLNAIIGYSEILLEDANDLGQKKLALDLEKILSAGHSLLSLINNILDLSKIEAGKMTFYIETFDVDAMIHDVETIIRPLVAKNDIELKVRIQPDIGSMTIDKTKVRQVLLNLLSNACKFTNNGTIILEALREGHGESDRLCFNIFSNEIRMNQEQFDRLMDTLIHADSPTTKYHADTGSGLCISKQFCRMMGGDLKVTHALGKEVTFKVRLPAVVTEVQNPTLAAVAQTVDQPLGTVLVIDDDEVVLEICQRFLTKEGFAVVTAQRGEDGITLAKTLRPTAITLDIMLPNMDGWEVLSVLKEDTETVDIPVIIMSILDEREIGFSLGATAYITKPIDRRQLSGLLIKIADERGPQSECSTTNA